MLTEIRVLIDFSGMINFQGFWSCCLWSNQIDTSQPGAIRTLLKEQSGNDPCHVKSSGLRTGTKSSVLVLSCLDALPLRAIKGQPRKEKKLINAPRPPPL